jgi:phytanoyl-CoA hydroxylase
MLRATTPIGTGIDMPETATEDDPYFSPRELADALAYYDAEGYVVLRGLVPAELCDRVRAAFDAEVRPSRAPILRQADMRYESNRFDADGFLANPIFNVQDLRTKRFGGFKSAALDVLTHGVVAATVAALLGDRAKLIQSMFFEGSVGTWAHQDSYYQDSAAEIGRCAAGWFALEDTAAETGRFYVCPKSHRAMPVIGNAAERNFADGHERYKEAVLAAARRAGLEWRSPFLAKGDVLFWTSRTVHGSLPARRPGVSRASLTAHYLREDDEMLQFHSRVRRQDLDRHNGMAVGRLHDQDKWRNRVVCRTAATFPRGFAAVRRAAIRLVVQGRSRGAARGLAASPG